MSRRHTPLKTGTEPNTMETFSAVPSFIRMPITVLDREKLEDWIENGALDSSPPTITKIFIVYTQGPGTPVPVQFEVDKIEDEYQDQIPTTEDQTNLTAREYIAKWRRANTLLRRNLLLAICPKLDPDDANILAHEDPKTLSCFGRIILERAGWIAPQTTDETTDEEEVETKGEVERVDETGESQSLMSLPSTQE